MATRRCPYKNHGGSCAVLSRWTMTERTADENPNGLSINIPCCLHSTRHTPGQEGNRPSIKINDWNPYCYSCNGSPSVDNDGRNGHWLPIIDLNYGWHLTSSATAMIEMIQRLLGYSQDTLNKAGFGRILLGTLCGYTHLEKYEMAMNRWPLKNSPVRCAGPIE